jgi:acetylornithine deacetylase
MLREIEKPDAPTDDRTDAQAALELAARSHDRSIEALAALVKIRSLTGEEEKVQQHVADTLRALHAEVVVEEPDIEQMFARFPTIAQYPTHWEHDLILPYGRLPTYEDLRASGLETVLNYRGRPNVVGRLKGTGGGRSLILNGHTDTVTIEPADEWTRQPFGAEIADGRMYGRGTSDMKGGVAAALMALTYLKEAGISLAGDVIVQSVVNEEHAGNGTLDLVTRGWRADAAVVLEPTSNTVAVSHPGGLYWQIAVPGTQLSPGARWRDGEQDGISAIEKVPAVIQALLAMEQTYNAQRDDDPLERGRARFALVIGRIIGGHYETVTAGEVIIKGSAYFSPYVGDVTAIMDAFRQSVETVNRNDPFLSVHPAELAFLHHDDGVLQPSDIDVAGAMANVLKRRGGDGEIKPGPFCCDMRHLVNRGGIPSIIFGPGTLTQAHKPDEYIAIADYLAAIDYLIEFICGWCGAAPSGRTATT